MVVRSNGVCPTIPTANRHRRLAKARLADEEWTASKSTALSPDHGAFGERRNPTIGRDRACQRGNSEMNCGFGRAVDVAVIAQTNAGRELVARFRRRPGSATENLGQLIQGAGVASGGTSVLRRSWKRNPGAPVPARPKPVAPEPIQRAPFALRGSTASTCSSAKIARVGSPLSR